MIMNDFEQNSCFDEICDSKNKGEKNTENSVVQEKSSEVNRTVDSSRPFFSPEITAFGE